ncbi:MAG: hypothetical protein A3B23_03600 [Candidatus Colwellbacteria bacterium RIFCSPLOWO2_01_FULL_48_10]|uniref:Uncharacterized protein n=1 Tax=Candidatus Colwellbacteria bacterium RIFCSPLOWO2_01_FULL_48_10 TaxID=1797690 RepID=A0A1G1Z6S4_9BACT|nr:MAG: hypothetical protein A3B23_03600 [Candidatus Colwellbacteria bacterium RIFCSPLOWO2_01_FULL_48_10]
MNDRLGALSGYAWNDGIGWISFSCDQTAVGGSNTCSTSNYGVNIDSETSEFMGYAWNDSIGWISFNCLDEGICDVSSYRVKTAWSSDILALDGYLISKTIDTGEAGGAAFNYILWRGDLGQTGNTVKFQLATSNCLNGAIDSTTAGDGAACNESIGWGGSKASGDGAFLGSGGTSVGYYEPNGPGIPAVIDALNHNNKRYYRYKMFLDRPTGNTISPVVEDVVVNWSP